MICSIKDLNSGGVSNSTILPLRKYPSLGAIQDKLTKLAVAAADCFGHCQFYRSYWGAQASKSCSTIQIGCHHNGT